MVEPNLTSLRPDQTYIPVEVIYALPHEQRLFNLNVVLGSTIADAIQQSGVLKQYPELELNHLKVGVFSKLATLSTELRSKDRVEIYRPLIADPKEVRKQRAAEGKSMKKGGGDPENSE